MSYIISDLKEQIEASCRFCNPPEKERILYETEHFYVMVSLGPIVEGYLLIVCKEHIGCCLHLSVEYFSEFKELKKKVKDILYSIYGSCLFYEHGKVCTSLTIGTDHHHCFHSHLHCVPVHIQLNENVSEELDGMNFPSLEDAYQFVNKENIERYLLVEDTSLKLYFPDTSLRSQYLRYILARTLNNISAWNWIDNQNWPLINKTINKLKSVFR